MPVVNCNLPSTMKPLLQISPPLMNGLSWMKMRRLPCTTLPIVPMFHANAWGFPHAAVMMGSKMVLPGRFMDPLRIASLMEKERVTVACGVPTIWIGLLHLLDREQFDRSEE